MKRIFIILSMVVFAFNLKIYAESTTCPEEEGYTIIECFDNQVSGTTYTTKGGASTATVIEEAPASSDNKALQVALTNNNQKVSFNVSLPCDNSLASYDNLIFKIYVTEQYKKIRYWIDDTKVTQSDNLTTNTWATVEFSLTSFM